MVQQLDSPTQSLQSLQCILVPQFLSLFITNQYEIMFQHFASFLNTILFSRGGVDGIKIDDQGLFDSENRIGGLVGIVADI